MTKAHQLGQKGEALAAGWLTARGYTLLHRNWRHGRAEVDIIASRDNVLHFVEVKSRSNRRFGYPEESVDEKKIQNLMSAADAFLLLFPDWKRIQFDVLSISILNNGKVDFFLIEDVYL